MERILVIGASPNPVRFAFQAVRRLQRKDYDVIPLGIRSGTIGGVDIMLGKPELKNITIVILYINPERQKEYYDYILALSPKRLIFNPGTENSEFIDIARDNGIKVELHCALVMIDTDRI